MKKMQVGSYYLKRRGDYRVPLPPRAVYQRLQQAYNDRPNEFHQLLRGYVRSVQDVRAIKRFNLHDPAYTERLKKFTGEN